MRKAPGDADTAPSLLAMPSAMPFAATPSNDNPTEASEGISLGDYARALRQRRAAEQSSAASAVAAAPAPASESAGFNPAALNPKPEAAVSGQKTTSLGDFAREVRTEREAARRARIQQKRAAQPNLAQRNAVQPPVHTDRATKTAPLAQQTAHTLPARKGVLPAIQATKDTAPADKAVLATPTAHTIPVATASRKTEQSPTQSLAHSKEVAAKPNAQPAPQPRAVLEPGAMVGEQSIRVPSGSSLWKLARVYLGAGSLWPALWKANPQIHDPNHIRAGQLLRCPALDDQNNAFRSAGLKQPSSAGSSPMNAVAERSKSRRSERAEQRSATAPAIQPRALVRKSLFSRSFSR